MKSLKAFSQLLVFVQIKSVFSHLVEQEALIDITWTKFDTINVFEEISRQNSQGTLANAVANSYAVRALSNTIPDTPNNIQVIDIRNNVKALEEIKYYSGSAVLILQTMDAVSAESKIKDKLDDNVVQGAILDLLARNVSAVGISCVLSDGNLDKKLEVPTRAPIVQVVLAFVVGTQLSKIIGVEAIAGRDHGWKSNDKTLSLLKQRAAHFAIVENLPVNDVVFAGAKNRAEVCIQSTIIGDEDFPQKNKDVHKSFLNFSGEIKQKNDACVVFAAMCTINQIVWKAEEMIFAETGFMLAVIVWTYYFDYSNIETDPRLMKLERGRQLDHVATSMAQMRADYEITMKQENELEEESCYGARIIILPKNETFMPKAILYLNGETIFGLGVHYKKVKDRDEIYLIIVAIVLEYLTERTETQFYETYFNPETMILAVRWALTGKAEKASTERRRQKVNTFYGLLPAIGYSVGVVRNKVKGEVFIIYCDVIPRNETNSFKMPSFLSQFSEFQLEAWEKHNEYRKLHDIRRLVLSKALCDFAQKRADRMVEEETIPDTNFYGENVYKTFMKINGSTPVDFWYTQMKLYMPSIPNEVAGISRVGFTPVIWKASTQLGIAKASKDGASYVVANYDIRANIRDEAEFAENNPQNFASNQ